MSVFGRVTVRLTDSSLEYSYWVLVWPPNWSVVCIGGYMAGLSYTIAVADRYFSVGPSVWSLLDCLVILYKFFIWDNTISTRM